MTRQHRTNDRQQHVIDEFRAKAGRVGGYFTTLQLLLLRTTGARSGLPHTAPLTFIPAEDGFVVLAANAGAPWHPDWYHNLVAHPRATVEVGSRVLEVTAVVEQGARREELLRRFAADSPQVGLYQAATTREFPVISLVPAQEQAG
jgi:deazaflavin-dependent oxidoreductase (nitroreductase family)